MLQSSGGLLTLVACIAIAYQGYTAWRAYRGAASFEFITAPISSPLDHTEASRKLEDYNREEWKQSQVIKVTDKVFVASGYALANSIMIEGSDGLVIVDTTESVEGMEVIMKEFRNISTKPVKAIIYTHFHPDHVCGARYILDEATRLSPEADIQIFAHPHTEHFSDELYFHWNISRSRNSRQFGATLSPETRYGLGIAPTAWVTRAKGTVPYPTTPIQDGDTLQVAGITLQFLFTPGETDDQIAVWLPDEKILFPGDNIYRTFPNLYAIRGSHSRDCKKWYQSLDKVRKLGAEYMVPSHTRPVVGKEPISDTLLVYRDAIKYIHDQTVRLLNKGLSPDDIVNEVKLPQRVAAHPYLQEHYGTVHWSVRGVFDHYMGWFSGNAADLRPLSTKERARKLLRLVTTTGQRTGVELILEQAQKSLEVSRDNFLKNGRYIHSEDQWALELVTMVLEIQDLSPEMKHVAKQMKISALTSLGVESTSANGRNYYLAVAKETERGMTLLRSRKEYAAVVMKTSISTLFEMFCLKVNGLQCQHKNYTISLSFTDSEKNFVLTLRNSVCDVIEGGSDVDPAISMSLTSRAWRAILSGDKDLAEEVVKGLVKMTAGTVKEFEAFMECFDTVV